MESPKFKFDSLDLQKAVTGAFIAGSGAALTYLIDFFTAINFGPYAVLVAAVLAVATNVVRKFLKGTKGEGYTVRSDPDN